MIRTFPPAERDVLETGLKRLKLGRLPESLDDLNELALKDEPS